MHGNMSKSEVSKSRRHKFMRSLMGGAKDVAEGESEQHLEIDQLIARVVVKMKELGYPPDVYTEDNVKFALSNNYSNNDPARAVELLTIFQEATEGILSPITHLDNKGRRKYYKLQGSDNYNGISCYLDSLLFAMFARLESFEPILYKTFDSDETRDSLALTLRFYVNMLRNGKLISTDIDKILVDQIFASGFNPPNSSKSQQDVSELFSFITEKLDMPLLTLRVDIAHGGKSDDKDDHKLINESLLHIPIPGSTNDLPIRLEDCLELYFSNSVHVSRQIERRRTLSLVNNATHPLGTRTRKFSIHSVEPSSPGSAQRQQFNISTDDCNSVISAALGDSPHKASNMGNSPHQKDLSINTFKTTATDSTEKQSSTIITNFYSRDRASSIINEDLPSYDEVFSKETPPILPPQKKNPLWTANNEFTLPAWMFLQLLPFYSRKRVGKFGEVQLFDDVSPVARHFANARPVLGICLKRYSWTDSGEPVRNARQVIIPQTIQLPTFVADDTDNDSTFGNFQLVLESAIFHRGNSINSGHYVALCCENEYMQYDGSTPSKQSKLKGDGQSMWYTKSLRLRGRRHQNSSNVSESDDDSTKQGLFDTSKIRKRWLLFDNLQPPESKVVEVDYDNIFNNECPYLVFYRMVSLDDSNRTSTQSLNISKSEGCNPLHTQLSEEDPLVISPSSLSMPVDLLPPQLLSPSTSETDYTEIGRRSFDVFRNDITKLHLPKSAQPSRSSSPHRKSLNASSHNHNNRKGKSKWGRDEERGEDEKCILM